MSTAVLEIEIEPELKKRAEVVFEELGTSASDVVNLLYNHVVVLKQLPKDLGKPPIPCIDDMTEEEFDAMIDEALDDIKNGRTYTLEETQRMLEVSELANELILTN